MRPDANQIALKATRSILANAQPFELTVDGRQVRCSVTRGAELAWPPIEGLTPEADGPWPPPLTVESVWDDGRVTLSLECDYWKTKGRYRHLIGLRVRLARRASELVWITVPRYIRDAQDGYSAPLKGAISTVKRKVPGAAERSRAVNDVLRELLRASGLPMTSASTAEICRVALPTGAIEPGADVALRRLVHLALLKLHFLDRGKRPPDEGRPLIDVVARLGDEAPELDELDEGDALDEDEDEVDEDAETAVGGAQLGARRYWAGAIAWGGESKRDEFLNNKYWQMRWPRSATTAPALVAFRRFDQIKPGDWFAIDGYGVNNQLRIHLVGEVTSIDPQIGRVEMRPLETPLYRGPAPGGAGAGTLSKIGPYQLRSARRAARVACAPELATASGRLAPGRSARSCVAFATPGRARFQR